MPLSRLIAQFIRQHWRPYVLSALMLMGVGVLTVFIPRQVGAIVDGLVAGQLHGNALLWQLGSLLLAGMGIYFLRVGWRLQLFAASYQLGVQLRTQLYQRLSLQGPSFYQQQRTGDLMALATNDVDAVEMAAGEAMLAGFDGTLTLLMVLAMMTLGVDWHLAAAALAPFPLMALAFWYISNQIHRASHDSLTRFSDLNDHVQETLAGVRTLRALGLEARSAQQFSELAEHAAEASLRAQRWEAAYEPAVGLTLVAAIGLTLGVGGYLVWQGELTVGLLTAFSMYLGQLIWPMFAAGWVMSLIERGRAAWSRLQPILDAPLTITDTGKVAKVEPGPLRLDGVQLRYPGQQAEALSDISFCLLPGQTLGLVGPTGAGKSSIVRLILRQYAQHNGSLFWGGHALADYQLEALHGAIAWVPQEPFLFSASVADNIALAKPDASRAEIEQVARLASVHEDILRFPQGYDTPVGERGVTLSGGQRQRVAIARALLADAPLLLLDDALSAVDTQTETDILGHLRDQRLNRTVIIVSHRLSAVMDADQILVLKHGRITETGHHADLLLQDGWYASQWRYQQLEASLDAL
ncbi:ABC transporter transmembrane domain-containing protein [Chitinimonas viridis]|uniref:ABC transporter transmembrane domain-containing protein n=1 Tax=Chitinimonas viridis TaxID=664880 RepID=A0ABT8B7T6_9NEIS|nr:ABC transporter transmembrane domain-containing protein [Chitinimonas viridis]MDN3577676.1 ABC transporter transmembrane domain-containing protein [Chitinimonas viridis]